MDSSSYYGLNLNSNELFDFVKDSHNKQLLFAAYTAISNCELWDWLKKTDIVSFMYHNNCREMIFFRKEMEKNPINETHSGASYGSTMRQIEYIAKYGYDCFASEYIRNFS